MLDYSERDGECICIRCVGNERARVISPLATPELAGCAAVLRALLIELEALSSQNDAAWERARLHELVQTSLGVVWWMTPPNLRIPGEVVIDEARVRELLAAYETKWGRATGVRSLVGTFSLWRKLQLKAAMYRELADMDQRYTPLIAAGGAVSRAAAKAIVSRGAA